MAGVLYFASIDDLKDEDAARSELIARSMWRNVDVTGLWHLIS